MKSTVWIAMLLILTSMNYAVLQTPLVLNGTVKSQGDILPNIAILAQDSLANNITRTNSSDKGAYSLIMMWDDPNTTAVEGVKPGQIISILVDNEKVMTYEVTTPGTHPLDLVVDVEGRMVIAKARATKSNTTPGSTPNLTESTFSKSKNTTAQINITNPNVDVKQIQSQQNNKSVTNISENQVNSDESASWTTGTAIILGIITLGLIIYFIVKK